MIIISAWSLLGSFIGIMLYPIIRDFFSPISILTVQEREAILEESLPPQERALRHVARLFSKDPSLTATQLRLEACRYCTVYCKHEEFLPLALVEQHIAHKGV